MTGAHSLGRIVPLALGVLILMMIGIAIMLRSARRDRLYQERVAAVLERPAPPSTIPEREILASEVTSSAGAGRSAISDTAQSRWILQILTRSSRRPRGDLSVMWIALVGGMVAALAIAQFLTRFFGTSAFCISLVFPVLVSRSVFASRDRRLQEAYRRQFPEALAIVARTVRVGVPVAEALRIVAREADQPTATEFAHLVNRVAIGVPLGEALHTTAETTGLIEHRLFASAVALQTQTGGGLTETLNNLSATIRKHLAARERAHALASEARTSAYILGGLPLVAGGLLALINPAYVAVLITDKSGNTILGLAFASLCMGAFAMRTIITRTLT